jgi:phosphocarrier protein FPr
MGLLDRLFTKSRTAVLHITSSNGFHLRPAAQFVNEAKKFHATVEAETRGKSINAKNLNALLSLNLAKGDHFDLICKGKDAEEAIERLTYFFETLMETDTEVDTIDKEVVIYEGETLGGEIIASGIAIAPLWHYREETYQKEESADFQAAIARSLRELEILHSKHKHSIDGGIYLAQKALLETLADGCKDLAMLEAAVTRESDTLRGGKMEAKIIDYQDMLSRVKKHLGWETTVPYPDTPCILVADDLLPSQIETLPTEIIGVILQQTSLTSHSAILLRAAGIPSLILQGRLPCTEAPAILDAHSGLLLPHPTQSDITHAKARQEQDTQTALTTYAKRHEAAATTTGKEIRLLANVTDISSAQTAKEEGAEGIGLLRTEFLFTEKKPDFNTQVEVYREIFALFDEITVRTLDIGGDKALPYVDLPQENNPFLGIRGVRLIQTHPELIEEQLHAIFKAADGKPVKVMFPMVATVEEFTQAKAFAHSTAQKYGCTIDTIRFGIMVEVPSVLFAIKQFNEVVDFYSIGTNDLTQYLFAIERTHPTLSFDPHAEVLFTALEKIIQEADKPVSLCGELAGDTEAISRLIEMGIETLSVSPKRIAPTKETIRHV